MGWFDTPDETAPAVEDALKHARSRALPVTASNPAARPPRKKAFIAFILTPSDGEAERPW